MVDKEQVIKYVLHTPNNPNKKVLETLLDSYLEDNSGTIESDVLTVVVPPVNGTTTITPSKPKENDTVIISTNANTDYQLNSLKVITINGKNISYVDNGNGTYSYTQPKQITIIVTDYTEDVTIWDGGGVSDW